MSRLFARSFRSSIIDSGKRTEMVLRDGFKFGKTTYRGFFPFTYSAESDFI